MTVINVNSAINVSGNRSSKVERDDQELVRTDRPKNADKPLEVTGQTPETDVTNLAESFKKFSEIRYDVVEDAKEKLDAGYYDDRTQAIRLAQSILDIS